MVSDEDVSRSTVEESTYRLVRARHGLFTWAPIPRKIRWCGYLALLMAVVTPLILFLPAEIAQAQFAGSPAQAQLSLGYIVLITLGTLIGAAIGLAAVAYRQAQLDEITDDQAWTLVGSEDLFSGFAFITGGLGAVSTVILAALGHLSAPAFRRLADLGANPYLTGGVLAMTPMMIGVVSVVCGVGLLVLSRVVPTTDP